MSKNDKKQTYCMTRGVPYLVGDAENIGKRVIVKARCKQWDCPYCAEVNKTEHYNRIANGINKAWKQGIEMQFVTVTCHEKWRGTDASVKNWRRNKDKLLARVRRQYAQDTKGSCEYVYIPEFHKDKTVHIHGIFYGNFGIRWWKNHSRASGLGYMADAKKLTSVLQAVNYITKYMVKEMGIPSHVKGFRRICYSQGFPPLPSHKSDFNWSLLERKTSIETSIVEGLLKGYSVDFEGKKFESVDEFLID